MTTKRAGVTTFAYADEAITERTTPVYRVGVTDVNDLPVEPAQMSSILLTLRDVGTDTLVNNRNAVEVFNANGGTFTPGEFAFQFVSDDTAIVGSPTASKEQRKMTLDFRMTGGGRFTHEVRFWIQALQDVTA